MTKSDFYDHAILSLRKIDEDGMEAGYYGSASDEDIENAWQHYNKGEYDEAAYALTISYGDQDGGEICMMATQENLAEEMETM
tara:strand:- start:2165 stop:2413 length:249 start_codon:yes stop_codon:yes gene_type:complete